MPKVKKKRLKKLKRFFSFWIPNHNKDKSEHELCTLVTPTDQPSNDVSDQCGSWSRPVALLIDDEGGESEDDTAPSEWEQLDSKQRSKPIAVVIKPQFSPDEVSGPLGEQLHLHTSLDPSISDDSKLWDAAIVAASIPPGSLVYAQTGLKTESLYNATGVLTFMTKGVGSEMPLEFLAVPNFGNLSKIYKTRSDSTSNTGSFDTHQRIAMLDFQRAWEIPNRLSDAPLLRTLCRRMSVDSGVLHTKAASFQHDMRTSNIPGMTGVTSCSPQRDDPCSTIGTLVRSAPGIPFPSPSTLSGEKGGILVILTPWTPDFSNAATLVSLQNRKMICCLKRALNTLSTVCTRLYIVGTVSKVYTSMSRQELRFHLENAWRFLESLAKCINRRGYIMEITSATATVDQVCIVISLHNQDIATGTDIPAVMMQATTPLGMALRFNEFELSERAVIYSGEDLFETETPASTRFFPSSTGRASIRNRVVKITLAQIRATSCMERPISILSFMTMVPAERRFPFPAIMHSRRPMLCLLEKSHKERAVVNILNGRGLHASELKPTKHYISTYEGKDHIGIMLVNKFLHKSLIIIPGIVKKSMITRMSIENSLFLQTVISSFSPETLPSATSFKRDITAEHRFPLPISTSQIMERFSLMSLLSRILKEKLLASDKLTARNKSVSKSIELHVRHESTQLTKHYTNIGINNKQMFNMNTLKVAERIAGYNVCEHARLSKELSVNCLHALGHKWIERLLSGTSSIRLELLDKIMLVLPPERPLCIRVINGTIPRERRFPLHRADVNNLHVSLKTAIDVTSTAEMKAPSRFNEKLAFWARINPIISPHVVVSSRNTIPSSETNSIGCIRPLHHPSINAEEKCDDYLPGLSEFIDDVINKSIQRIDCVDDNCLDQRQQKCGTDQIFRKRSRVKYLQYKFLQWHLSGSVSAGHQSTGISSSDKFWCTDRAKYFLPRPFKMFSTKEPVGKCQEEADEISKVKEVETDIQNGKCLQEQNGQIRHQTNVSQEEETQMSEVNNQEEIEIQDTKCPQEEGEQIEHLPREPFDAQFLQKAKDHRLKERPATSSVNLWRMSRYLQFLLKNKNNDGTECPPDSRWPTQDIRWNKLNPTKMSIFSSQNGHGTTSDISSESSSDTREETSDHIVHSEESQAAGVFSTESRSETPNTSSASKAKIRPKPSRIPRAIGHLCRNASTNKVLRGIEPLIQLVPSQMGHGSRISSHSDLGIGVPQKTAESNNHGRSTKCPLSKIPFPRPMASSSSSRKSLTSTTVGSKCFPSSSAQGIAKSKQGPSSLAHASSIPKKGSMTPAREMTVPRKGSMSISREMAVPKKRLMSAAREMVVPKKGSITAVRGINVPKKGSITAVRGINVSKKGSSNLAQGIVMPKNGSSKSTDAVVVPKKETSSSPQGNVLKERSMGSTQGLVVPMKRSSNSAQGVVAPRKVFSSPGKEMVMPKKGLISLPQGMNVPKKVSSSSNQRMGVSKKESISVTQGVVRPKKGSGSSIEGTLVSKKVSTNLTQKTVVLKSGPNSSVQGVTLSKKLSSRLNEGVDGLNKGSSSSIEEMVVSKKASGISAQKRIVPKNGSRSLTQGTDVLKKELDPIRRNISTKTAIAKSSSATKGQTASAKAKPLPSQNKRPALSDKSHNDEQCGAKQRGMKQQHEVLLESSMHISDPCLVSKCTSLPCAVSKLTNQASSLPATASCEGTASPSREGNKPRDSGSSSPKVAQKRPWDCAKVLSYLKHQTPLKNLTVKQLTLKLVMLLNLVTENCTILHELSLNDFSIDETKACFRSHAPIESQAESTPRQPILELHSYTADVDLCVVEVLKEYIKRTKKLRKSRNLLINYMPPYDVVGSDVISRWVKTVLSLSGVDVHVSTMNERSSSSEAQLKAIMDACCWPDKCRFVKFYHKDLAN